VTPNNWLTKTLNFNNNTDGNIDFIAVVAFVDVTLEHEER
jgi:hypothetical protein